MKKNLLRIAFFVALVALVKHFAPKMGSIDWEKRFQQMPDNAPPKWMFHNITTIRENTEQILKLVDQDRAR